MASRVPQRGLCEKTKYFFIEATSVESADLVHRGPEFFRAEIGGYCFERLFDFLVS